MALPLTYLDDFTPGSNRLPARSWLHSDAPSLSLNGEWAFRLWPSAAEAPDDVLGESFDDTSWDRLPIPSHWVLHGDGAYGLPAYTNVQYPFPVDPPYVPDENPTGDHRRRFTLPDAGASVDRWVLRFDGVESVYRVWLNGAEVGVGKGSRLPTEFDVTDHVRAGENVLVVRVHQWSSMSYLEDQDQWWLPGIFRDVTLLGRPPAGITDVWVRTGFDADTGRGWLQPEVTADDAAFPVVLRVPDLGVEQAVTSATHVERIDVGPVDPWSAEAPRRYGATVANPAETITLQLGFRTVRIEGDRFLVNGRPVTFRGMNRHETNPDLGRVFDPEQSRADLLAMKRHNVNAIRTSHYPPHPALLDMLDELGFWVVAECDLETHGFGFVDWVGNPSDDPRWEAAYRDRITRTLERDKNHPSVVIWSLGNESGTGRNLAAMAQWVHRRDPERPVHYEGDYTGAYTDVYSRMYPTLEETAAIGGEVGELLGCGPAEAARVRTKPFLMCEYAHAMGNGPGALAEYEALTDAYPRLHGGFIWEWRDHGLRSRTADGTEFFAYGGDFGEVVHDGNFVMDGMVLPDGTPTPGLAQFAAVAAPVRLGLTTVRDGSAPAGQERSVVSVHNRQQTLTTDHLRFVAVLETDGAMTAEAELDVDSAGPGGTTVVALPDTLTPAAGSAEAWLTLRAELRDDAPWAEAGHVVASSQHRLSSGAREPRAWPAGPLHELSGDVIRLGPVELDGRTGSLRRVGDLEVGGPVLELWRGPTDNDRGAGQGSYELADPALTYGRGAPGPPSATRWRQRGLDRLVSRVRSVQRSDDQVEVAVRVSAATHSLGVEVRYRWWLDAEQPDAVRLRVEFAPDRGWDCTWPRVGVRLDLPVAADRASWFGTGPLESYADSLDAARVGRFTADLGELNVRYSRPQETGHRPALRELVVGSATGDLLVVSTDADASGHRPGFTLTPWTPQQLDVAAHPYELPEPEHTYLFLDDAQHGLGSRACGIDVLPSHALWPRAGAFSLALRPGG